MGMEVELEQGMARGLAAGERAGKPRGSLVRLALGGYTLLAWGFVLFVVAQVFFAGMAVFVSPLHWVRHVTFVHTMGFLPLPMFLLALIGRLGGGLWWRAVGLWLLIGVQYMTAHMRGEAGAVWLSALHPVNALLMFWFALHTARRAWSLTLKAAAPPA